MAVHSASELLLATIRYMPTQDSPKPFLASIPALYWLLIVSIVCLFGALFAWWQVVYKNPANVWNGMLENNFSTSGFTHHTSSDSNGVTVKETAQTQLGAQNLVHSMTVLSQQTDTVKTEAINTPGASYVRYLQIKTSTKDPNGKPLDFSHALNIWAKGDLGGTGAQDTFAQTLFGILPMGNVPPVKRIEILQFMDKNTVFSINYDNVKKEKQGGRFVYIYNVQLVPQTYVQMLKLFGESVGLADRVAGLDPADYANASPTDLTVSVDVLSRHVKSVKYTAAADRNETYEGYGIQKHVNLPQKTIPITELSQRLSGQLQ